MKERLLDMLRQAQDYLSGQDISQRLGVSRTAVWKTVNQLKTEGYQIESIRNRGYKLLAAPDAVTREEISCRLKTEWAGREIIYFDVTDSTNVQARQLAEAGAPEGTLVVAECQQAGRGRRGRSWDSPKGTGIFMTLVLRPKADPSRASMLTLVAALAVRRGIEAVCGLKTEIKWPNDIVYQGRKLVGILTEMRTEGDEIRYVVAGIGINVNMEAFPEDIASTASSLYLAGGQKVCRARLIAEIMGFFEGYYEAFQKTADLSGLQDEYNACLVNRGRRVRVLAPGQEYEALALGIDTRGELLVRREDGTEEAVSSGEVSVRGVYGYV